MCPRQARLLSPCSLDSLELNQTEDSRQCHAGALIYALATEAKGLPVLSECRAADTYADPKRLVSTEQSTQTVEGKRMCGYAAPDWRQWQSRLPQVRCRSQLTRCHRCRH